MRYRGTASAELWRALRMLKALQNEGAIQVHEAGPAVPHREPPIEPEAGEIAGLSPRHGHPAPVPTMAAAA